MKKLLLEGMVVKTIIITIVLRIDAETQLFSLTI
jgi:hypothetical protein